MHKLAAITAGVGALALAVAGIYYSIRSGAAVDPVKVTPARTVPVGSFKTIHFVKVIEGEGHSIQDQLPALTCFDLYVPESNLYRGDDKPDGTLRVEMFLYPPEGKAEYSIGDMDIMYKGVLKNRRGRALWNGEEGTRQRVRFGPGVHVPDGVSFHKDISPEDAERLLLHNLSLFACGAASKD